MVAAAFRSLIAAPVLVAATGALADVGWREVLRQPEPWYATPEARKIADNVLLYQHASGGWPKNTDMTAPPPPVVVPPDSHDSVPDVSLPTIDNGATTTQLELLARVISSGGHDAVLREAFDRGFDYLLASQYENGGWPQFFPLRKGYYSHITFNDDAMANVLGLLRGAAHGKAPYAFVDEARRARAATAVARGIECILATQVRRDGRPLGWCAQHHEISLEPAWARNFEPPSLSGHESVGIVRFLMSIEHPDPRTVAAIESAVAWLRGAAIRGLRVERFTGADGKRDVRTVADPDAPPVWARFYDLDTGQPMFYGRDRLPHPRLDDLEYERRNGYGYLGDWPAKLLEKEYPKWRKKHGLP